MSAAIFLVLVALCGLVKFPVDGKPVVTSVSRDLPDVAQEGLLSEPVFQEEEYQRESDVLQDEFYILEGTRVRRQAVRNKTRIWPGGVVPYVLDKAFTPDQVVTIEASMREVEQNVGNSTHPCVRFIPRTTEVNYLDAHAGNGCSSVIGLDFTGPQVSTYAPACVMKGLLLHELLHTLGIYHEQDRFDRNDFISMNASNLRADAERNYVLKNMSDIDILGTSYDFGSIMHYGPYSFPKDPQYPVMTPKPKYAAGTYMGQRSALSVTDVLRVQRLYSCPEDTSHLQSDITEDKILLWCDFENGTCDFTVTTSQEGVSPTEHDNNKTGSSSEPADDDDVLWVVTRRATKDGPKTGSTNGLDPFFYASRKIREEIGQNSPESHVSPFDKSESHVSPFDKSESYDSFARTTEAPGKYDSTSVSLSPLEVSPGVLLRETLTVPLFPDQSTQKSPISDAMTQKSPISDAQTQKSPISDTQTQKSPISDAQTQKSPINDAQTHNSPISDAQTHKSSESDTPTQESAVSNNWTQNSSPSTNSTDPTPQTPNSTSSTDKVTVSLTTPILNTGDMCLDIRIFQGAPDSFLELYVKGPLFKRARFFTNEGRYVDHWMTLKLSMPMTQGIDFQLELVAVLGEGPFALDDVHILKGICK